MEKAPSFEKKIISLADIRHFVVDRYGNVEVVEEGNNKLVVKQGGRIIKVLLDDHEENK